MPTSVIADDEVLASGSVPIAVLGSNESGSSLEESSTDAGFPPGPKNCYNPHFVLIADVINQVGSFKQITIEAIDRHSHQCGTRLWSAHLPPYE